MITPEKMSKLRIIVPKSAGYKIINKLYNLELLHIKPYEEGKIQGVESGKPLLEAEELSKALLTVRALKTIMELEKKSDPMDSESLTPEQFTKIQDSIQKIHDQYSTLEKRKKQEKKQVSSLTTKVKILKTLQNLGIDNEELSSLSLVTNHIGRVKQEQDLQALKNIKGAVIKEVNLGEDVLIVLFSKKNQLSKIESILKDVGFRSLDLEEIAALDLKKIVEDLEQEKVAFQNTSKKIMEITQKNTQFLIKHETLLEEEIKKAELPLQFATTKESLIATGYVPEKNLAKIKESLINVTQGAVVFEELEKGHHENVPVKLDNPNPIKSFEVLTRLYELPQHIEADPSILLFLTFPLFFGIMLGDVGYGIITLLLFLFIKKKVPSTKDFMNVLVIASIITIIFGGVYGEYLGFEHVSVETGEKLCNVGLCLHKEILESHGMEHVVYDFPRLLNRGHSHVNIMGYEILTVLIMGVIIGFFHLNFGLLIGFYNIWRAHGLWHAFLEKISWMVMQTGVILIVLTMLGMVRLRMWVGIGIFAISIVLLYMGEGAKGIIELPAIFSNMLSYMRLGAVGLASLGLAVVVNENLAKPFIEMGGFYIIIAIIVMIIGHTVNIGLGVLGPFLHAIRLHYVEFFSKFFHGGGQEYKPFGVKTAIGGE